MRHSRFARWLGCVLACLPLPSIAATTTFPADAGLIDVTAAPYHADPSGIQDSTWKIQRAIADHLGTTALIYFPNGTYRVSRTLDWMRRRDLTLDAGSVQTVAGVQLAFNLGTQRVYYFDVAVSNDNVAFTTVGEFTSTQDATLQTFVAPAATGIVETDLGLTPYFAAIVMNKLIPGILASLVLPGALAAQVLMFDFGPTTTSGASLTNSPYHTAAPGFTDTTWNKVQTPDLASGLLFADGTAATGVGINVGASVNTSTLMTIGLGETPSGNTQLATGTGIYAGTSVGTDAIFEKSNSTGTNVGSVGVQITGLVAGTYTL